MTIEGGLGDAVLETGDSPQCLGKCVAGVAVA